MSPDQPGPPFDGRVFVLGVVLGAVLLAAVWAGISLTSDDGGPSRAPVGAVAAPGDAVVEPATLQTVCQEVFAGQQAPLDTAARAMEQWDVHIGAMNQLVVGAISLQQANQFWNDTRVGARRRLEAYAGAQQGFATRLQRCPARPDPSADAALQTCQRVAAARSRALRRAGVALDTWREHVHHMEMLRKGEMSPTQATRLWLDSWREGTREVRRYREALAAAQDGTC